MSVKNKAVVISLLVTLVIVPLLAGCVTAPTAPAASGAPAAAATSAPAKVEIQMWHRWSGATGDAAAKLARDFEATHPDITVKDVSQAGEYIDLLQKMNADMAAGKQPPDVLIGGYNFLNYIAAELKPVPMDQLGGAEAQAVFDRYDPSVLKLGAVNGQQIGLPFALSNIVMYYNADLFKAAGLDPNNPPKTWDEVTAQGMTLKEKTGKYAIAIQKVDNWPDQALIFSNGGQLLSADQKCVAFNNPQAVEAYQMWAKLHSDGLAPKITDEEANASFTAGNLGMWITTIFRLGTFRSQTTFDLGVAPLPAFDGKPTALPGGGAAIMVFAKDPAKQKAAWELAKYLTSQEAMASWTKTGYLNVIKAEVPVAKGQEVAYEQRARAVPWLSWPGGSKGLEIDRNFLSERTKIIYGDEDAKTGLDKAAADANSMLTGCAK